MKSDFITSILKLKMDVDNGYLLSRGSKETNVLPYWAKLEMSAAGKTKGLDQSLRLSRQDDDPPAILSGIQGETA